jgi:hypothetical protein
MLADAPPETTEKAQPTGYLATRGRHFSHHPCQQVDLYALDSLVFPKRENSVNDEAERRRQGNSAYP